MRLAGIMATRVIKRTSYCGVGLGIIMGMDEGNSTACENSELL